MRSILNMFGSWLSGFFTGIYNLFRRKQQSVKDVVIDLDARNPIKPD